MISGSVRVISKRKGGVVAGLDEVVIDVDRTNPLLGNRFVLHDHRDNDERGRVVAAYEAELEADVAANGPKSQELDRIAGMVRNGVKVAFRCWCAPRRCHGDALARIVGQRSGLAVASVQKQEDRAWQQQLL